MKRFLATLLTIACALAFTANAQAAKKHSTLTADQKALRKEMLEKYDLNKDGKLDRAEHAKMSKEDKSRWAAAFGRKHQGKKTDPKPS